MKSSVPELLAEIADLIEKHGEVEHALSFRKLSASYEAEPNHVKSVGRRLFGGMGSFNDLVLHDESGQPLVSENDVLDELKSSLYRACRE